MSNQPIKKTKAEEPSEEQVITIDRCPACNSKAQEDNIQLRIEDRPYRKIKMKLKCHNPSCAVTRYKQTIVLTNEF